MKSQIINYWARISDCITFPENFTINKEFKIVSAKKKKKDCNVNSYLKFQPQQLDEPIS